MLAHGVAVQLTPRVRRIVARNPGVMTGPGTNTYLVGEQAVAVLDPGPAEHSHIDAILEAAGDHIRWVICTHSHPDHSPAAAAVARATGAEVLGGIPPDDGFQDPNFAPTTPLVHDYLLDAGEFTLRAVHTPGHVGNHYCLFLEEEGMLFAGDHIMNGSTVVIIPPSGDMRAYIDSLKLLLDYPMQHIAPGHGDLMGDPRAVVEWLVDHRLGREAKVVAGLQRLGRATVDELLGVVYDDVDSSLYRMARLSLSAHLIKLRDEARAACSDTGDHWELLDSS